MAQQNENTVEPGLHPLQKFPSAILMEPRGAFPEKSMCDLMAFEVCATFSLFFNQIIDKYTVNYIHAHFLVTAF
jgi:hypothetical protein